MPKNRGFHLCTALKTKEDSVEENVSLPRTQSRIGNATSPIATRNPISETHGRR